MGFGWCGMTPLCMLPGEDQALEAVGLVAGAAAAAAATAAAAPSTRLSSESKGREGRRPRLRLAGSLGEVIGEEGPAARLSWWPEMRKRTNARDEEEDEQQSSEASSRAPTSRVYREKSGAVVSFKVMSCCDSRDLALPF